MTTAGTVNECLDGWALCTLVESVKTVIDEVNRG